MDIKVNLEVKFTKAIPVAPTHIYLIYLVERLRNKSNFCSDSFCTNVFEGLKDED